MMEIMGKVPPEERTPYVVVAFQETERMNMLTSEIQRSLKELDLGLKVCMVMVYMTKTYPYYCIPGSGKKSLKSASPENKL